MKLLARRPTGSGVIRSGVGFVTGGIAARRDQRAAHLGSIASAPRCQAIIDWKTPPAKRAYEEGLFQRANAQKSTPPVFHRPTGGLSRLTDNPRKSSRQGTHEIPVGNHDFVSTSPRPSGDEPGGIAIPSKPCVASQGSPFAFYRHRTMRILTISLAAIAVFFVAATYAGPVSSGALFLMVPPRARVTDHRVRPSHEPFHKGGVDPGTGLYIREDEDLFVADTMPLVLTRTYLSGDHVSRRFGVGGSHPAEWYLIGDSAAFQWAELILAQGGRIHFDRVSSGTSFATALFEHRRTPTSFFGSRLGWVGLEWALRFRDGSLALFQGCGPGNGNTCSLIEMRDADRHQTRYVRDRSGLLVKIQGPTQEIAFDYDARRRIVGAHDSTRRSVRYSYDDGGRVSRVVPSDGTIRTYTYNARDEMLTIDEPGWFITNTFDDAGRVIRQVTKLSDSEEPVTFEFVYTVRHGSVVQTDVTRNGELTCHTYNSSHYEVSETIDPDGPDPISVSFDRSESTNLTHALTVRCLSPDGHVIRTVAATSGAEESIASKLIRQECR
jgi:YD repeat-containing protein